MRVRGILCDSHWFQLDHDAWRSRDGCHGVFRGLPVFCSRLWTSCPKPLNSLSQFWRNALQTPPRSASQSNLVRTINPELFVPFLHLSLWALPRWLPWEGLNPKLWTLFPLRCKANEALSGFSWQPLQRAFSTPDRDGKGHGKFALLQSRCLERQVSRQ